jgi:hypothetical protein
MDPGVFHHQLQLLRECDYPSSQNNFQDGTIIARYDIQHTVPSYQRPVFAGPPDTTLAADGTVAAPCQLAMAPASRQLGVAPALRHTIMKIKCSGRAEL